MKGDVTLLLRGARQVLTLARPLPASDARGTWSPEDLGLIEDGAVAISGDRVVAVGPTAEVEQAVCLARDAVVVDVGDRVIAPGLVDPHTHALFLGQRADEYSARVRGDGYAAIAARGGGIARSVAAVRGASDEVLRASLTARLDRMERFGTTTVEVKTGYALSLEQELRCLEAIASAGDRAVATFLPLHAVPPDLRAEPEGRAKYLDDIVRRMLPAALAQGHARFIDAYVDGPGFSVAECLPALAAARDAGLGVRLHVGQFDDVGGAELAASLGAASADHLESVSDAGVRAMAEAGVVGVLLPGAAFSLGQPMPDARRLRGLGLAVALATDCNPGTSHTESLPLMAAFAVRQMGMTTVEAWHAVTRAAADSLWLPDRGRLTPGARADVAVMDFESWECLPYDFGSARAWAVVRGGRLTVDPSAG